MLQGFSGCFPSLRRANRAAMDCAAAHVITGQVRQRPLGASLGTPGCSGLPTTPEGSKPSPCPGWRLLLGPLELPSPPVRPFFFAKPLVRFSASSLLSSRGLLLPSQGLCIESRACCGSNPVPSAWFDRPLGDLHHPFS